MIDDSAELMIGTESESDDPAASARLSNRRRDLVCSKALSNAVLGYQAERPDHIRQPRRLASTLESVTRRGRRRPGRGVAVLLVLATTLAGCATAHAARMTSPSPTTGFVSPPSAVGPRLPLSLTVTALGDSVTAGSHCQCRAFPSRYGDDLRARYGLRVHVTNDGVSGQHTTDLQAGLVSDPALQSDVRAADVVVVTIGANDFAADYPAVTGGTCGGEDDLGCARTDLDALGPRLTAVLRRVAALRDGRPTAVLVTGYWNVFQDGSVAASTLPGRGRATSDRLTRAANIAIADAAEVAGDTYIDLYRPFKGEHAEQDPSPLLAADGDHPNAAGHRLIAQTLLEAGLGPLG